MFEYSGLVCCSAARSRAAPMLAGSTMMRRRAARMVFFGVFRRAVPGDGGGASALWELTRACPSDRFVSEEVE